MKLSSTFLHLCAFVGIAVLTWAAVATAAPAASSNRLITLEDFLNASAFYDMTTFSPTGNAYVFERKIPYTKQHSWGYRMTPLVRSRVFVATNDGKRVKEIRNTLEEHYSIPVIPQIWSMNGRELLLISTNRNSYGLTAYNLISGKIVHLPGRLSSIEPVHAWAPGGRIIYTTIPPGVNQRSNMHDMLTTVEKKWSGAWYGHQPQVTVSSNSPVMETSNPPLGALISADPRTGASFKLATGDYYAISVSPDGRYLAVIQADRALESTTGVRSGQRELAIYRFEADGRVRLLRRYKKLDVSSEADGYSALCWSPSGDRLLIAAQDVFDHTHEIDLYIVSPGSRKTRKIQMTRLSLHKHKAFYYAMTLQVGWVDNRPIAVAAHADKRGTGNTESPVNGAQISFNYGSLHNVRLDVYAMWGGHLENLTKFANTSVSRFIVPPGADYALVIANGALWEVAPGTSATRISPKGAPRIVGFGQDHGFYPRPTARFLRRTRRGSRISLEEIDKRGEPVRAVFSLRSHRLVPVQVPGKIIATAPDQLTTVSKVSHGWVSSLVMNTAESHVTLMTINTGLKNKTLLPVKHFVFTYHGKRLNGWIVLPPNAKSSSTVPAIVDIYGGTIYGAVMPPDRTGSMLWALVPSLNGQLLAAQGYAVIFASTPIGRGAKSNMMETLAGETMAAVNELASKGVVDKSHVGVIGESFGGYSTAAILAASSNYYKAGIAMAGIYDYMLRDGLPWMYGMMRNNDGDIYSGRGSQSIQQGQPGFGGQFWDDPKPYIRNSPIFHVKDYRAPLLMLVGGFNQLAGAERMYIQMRSAGKTVALVRYWAMPHVPKTAWAIRDKWERITAWFAYYVKGEPPARE